MDLASQSPVGNKRFTVGSDQYIRGFEISMCDVLAMRIGDRIEDIDQSTKEIPELPGLFDRIGKCSFVEFVDRF
jgi:hypothetical protein